MSACLDHVAIRHAHRRPQHRVGHRPAIHHQALLPGCGPAMAWRRRIASQHHPVPRTHHGQQPHRGAEQRRHPGRPRLHRQVEHDPPVDLEAERRMGCGKRQPRRRLLRMVRFGPRRLQELAPRRGREEKVRHHDPRPRPRPHRRHLPDPPPLHKQPVPMRGPPGPRRDLEPCRRPDAGQCLAAEPERRDPHQRVPVVRPVRQLAGAVPLHRQQQVVGLHAAPVILDHDPLDPAALQRHGHARRPGVQRVLHQLLHRRSRSLDHLAGRDAVHQALRQSLDSRSLHASTYHASTPPATTTAVGLEKGRGTTKNTKEHQGTRRA